MQFEELFDSKIVRMVCLTFVCTTRRHAKGTVTARLGLWQYI